MVCTKKNFVSFKMKKIRAVQDKASIFSADFPHLTLHLFLYISKRRLGMH